MLDDARADAAVRPFPAGAVAAPEMDVDAGGPAPATQEAASSSAMPAVVPAAMQVEDRTRTAEAAEGEPRAKAPRIANLLVSVDMSDPNYLGLDGENFDRLKLFATTVRDRDTPKAWADDLVPEAVVYDSRTGEVLPKHLVRDERLNEVGQMNSFYVYDDIMEYEAKGRRVR